MVTWICFCNNNENILALLGFIFYSLVVLSSTLCVNITGIWLIVIIKVLILIILILNYSNTTIVIRAQYFTPLLP